MNTGCAHRRPAGQRPSRKYAKQHASGPGLEFACHAADRSESWVVGPYSGWT